MENAFQLFSPYGKDPEIGSPIIIEFPPEQSMLTHFTIWDGTQEIIDGCCWKNVVIIGSDKPDDAQEVVTLFRYGSTD